MSCGPRLRARGLHRSAGSARRPPCFARRFPALFFDNLSSLLGILGVMLFVPFLALSIGAPITPAHAIAFGETVFGRVGPGIAFSLVFGNVWYSWMAFKLAGYENRDDVTALPYGINTPAGFVMAFSVVLPLCFKHAGEADPNTFALKVWAGACSANFIGGIFEVAGCWLGNPIRRNTSKAALYAPIASVGFVYLGLGPIIAVGAEPIIGMIPLALCFTGFFANGGKGIYGSGVALVIFAIGTALKWAGAGRYQGSVASQGQAVVQAWSSYAGKNVMLPGVALSGMAVRRARPRPRLAQVPARPGAHIRARRSRAPRTSHPPFPCPGRSLGRTWATLWRSSSRWRSSPSSRPWRTWRPPPRRATTTT